VRRFTQAEFLPWRAAATRFAGGRAEGKSENILSWIAEAHLRFAEASKLSGTLMPMAAGLPYHTAPEGWHLGLTIPGGFHAGKSASDPPM
jgi:hypothetical protein